MKRYFIMVYAIGKDTATHTVESFMSDHFTRLASFYSQNRTFDHEAIMFFSK